jgi:hypothetical protein
MNGIEEKCTPMSANILKENENLQKVNVNYIVNNLRIVMFTLEECVQLAQNKSDT